MARRRESHAAQRERLLRGAAKVAVPDTCDVLVVGAGAAGLACAIFAAEEAAAAEKDLRVVALDRGIECGRTILATGNGRCNFSNLELGLAHYNRPEFVGSVVGDDFLGDVLRLFGDSGLAWASEEGRLYPLSRQAASVREVLLSRARRAGVILAPAREVTSVERPMPGREGFRVRYARGWDAGAGTIRAMSVVLASGGTDSLAESLGLGQVPKRPVLTALATSGVDLSPIDGRRTHARVALVRDGATLHVERGEVLFRTYGVSGIAVFNMSRRALPADTLAIDLAPGVEESRIADCLGRGLPAEGFLDPVVAQWASQLAGGDPDRVAALAKGLRLRVEGVAEPERAQVMRGGIDCASFSPTLESSEVPGLFACGEALDVDGDCGGYNLSWAWKSGMVAGAAAAERTLA